MADEIYTLSVPGRPVPKSYSRRHGSLYRPAAVREKEREIGYRFRGKYGLLLLEGPLFFSLEAHVPDRRHGDLKNYIYLAEDALSRIAYEDDRQIKFYLCPMVKATEEEPKTVIRLGELGLLLSEDGFSEVMEGFVEQRIGKLASM
ncbi:MAG: RusA family crossover junction endodeoxyribonuclease [Candidatus Acetothermia bacterium]